MSQDGTVCDVHSDGVLNKHITDLDSKISGHRTSSAKSPFGQIAKGNGAHTCGQRADGRIKAHFSREGGHAAASALTS